MRTAAIKRAIDIVTAFTALVIASPLIALAAVVILIDGGHPVFSRQERIGRCGVPFELWQLRTMAPRGDDSAQRRYDEQELAGELPEQAAYTLESDSRITRVGRFLRRYSADGLPQLYHVPRDEMSLVGPRPDARLSGRAVRRGSCAVWTSVRASPVCGRPAAGGGSNEVDARARRRIRRATHRLAGPADPREDAARRAPSPGRRVTVSRVTLRALHRAGVGVQ